MRKTIKLFLAVVVAAFLGIGTSAMAIDRANQLKIYNWSDYIDEDALKEFEEWYKEQTGEEIKIIYQVFDINEVMLTKIEKGHEDYDLVCPSEYIIERMLKMDLLLPIDTNFGQTPNYIHNVSNFIRQELNRISNNGRIAQDYAVAYMWGTTGLLYNSDKVPFEDIRSWSVLWNEKYARQLLMKESYRDVYGTVAIYAFRDQIAAGTMQIADVMNCTADSIRLVVEDLLFQMKPNVAGWEADFGKEMMTKQKALINLTWSGDAVWAIDEAAEVGVNLDYYVPEEGSNVWYDGWVIPKYAKNVKAASYFINFLCRSDIALRNMEATGYVSAVATAEVLEAQQDDSIEEYYDLSYFFGEGMGADSIHINPVLYPDITVAQRCAMMRDFGEDTEVVMELWSRVKGNNLNLAMIWFIVAIIALIVVFFVLRSVNKRKQQAVNRKKK